MLVGTGILGWKNLNFTGKQQVQLILFDLLFIANFLLFSFWDIEFGLNYLLSGVVGVILIVYIRHSKLKQNSSQVKKSEN